MDETFYPSEHPGTFSPAAEHVAADQGHYDIRHHYDEFSYSRRLHRNPDEDAPGQVGEPDLDAWWVQLNADLAARGVAVYPVTNWHDDASTGRDWPADRSAGEFLALAEQLNVRLIYARLRVFDQAEAERIDLEGAEAYYSRIPQIGLRWYYLGVQHRCAVRAEWYPLLLRKAADDRQARKAAREAKITELANALARNPAFGKAGGEYWHSLKKGVAEAMYPDLDERVRSTVASRAHDIYRKEVAPERDRALAKQGKALMDNGTSRAGAARQLGITPARLERLVQVYATTDTSDRSSESD